MRTTVQVVRTSVLILAFFLSAFISTAQSLSTPDGKFEIGLGIGPLFFLGDLGGNRGVGTTLVKDINLPLTKVSKGLFVNFYPTEFFGFRVAVNQGVLQGADSLVKDNGGEELYRKARNLSFRSNLLEAYAAAEIYPTVFFEQYDGLQGKIRPYGVIGIGMFHFNPQTQYYSPNGTSRWVDLKPLHTEGEGFTEYPDKKEYKLTQMEIPMGVGVKYYVKDNMYLGFEIMHRKTFTDYIDDVSTEYIDPALFDKYLAPEQAVIAKQVSFRGNTAGSLYAPNGEQRGNKKLNDSFFSSILRFGWRLFDNSTAEHMGCPKW
ncbi:MAG: DUF6089 family protein [Bacteroidota bacterium]|nr:DUF6089 family protein [Bacteroidota bacterium]